MLLKTRRIARGVSLGLATAGLTAALVACAPVTNSGSSPASTNSSSAVPTVKPTFAADGTANDNIAYFRYLVDASITKEGLNANTEVLAKKLAASGFRADEIQYTDNSTAAGMSPDSVAIAALFKGQCLIAQYGPGVGGLTITLLPPLKSGGCLLGRSINHL